MSSNRILISDAVANICVDLLVGKGHNVDYKPDMTSAHLLATISGYDGLIVRSATKVTANLIARATKLKVIGRAGTGLDNIDVDFARSRGIRVLNAPGGNAISAAEHAFALMMALCRLIPHAHISVANGEWRRGAFKGVELYGKTLGIVGLGQIGKEIATRAQAFAMDVIAFDEYITQQDFDAVDVRPCSFVDIFLRSDFVTVHAPLNTETRHMIGAPQFQICKPGLRLINAARGGIVDEEALYGALCSGQVAAAALDVFENEPPEQSPLFALPNIIMTPHLGASTHEAQERIAAEIAESVARIFL